MLIRLVQCSVNARAVQRLRNGSTPVADVYRINFAVYYERNGAADNTELCRKRNVFGYILRFVLGTVLVVPTVEQVSFLNGRFR